MDRKPSSALIDPVPRFNEVFRNCESLPSADSAPRLLSCTRPLTSHDSDSSAPRPKIWPEAQTGLKPRRLIKLTLIVLAAVSASIAGAQETAQPQDNDQRVVGLDGSCEMMVPRTWKSLSDPTGRAAITMGDITKDQFLSIMMVNKSDYDGSSADFLQAEATAVSAHLKDPTDGDPEQKLVAGLQGQAIRIEGTDNHYKVVYTVMVVENKDRFYRILTFTRPSSEQNANELYEKVLATFDPIDGDASHKTTGNF